jgi:hypothetical protein
MIRPPIILRTPTLRQFAASYILDVAPDDCMVLFKKNKRTLEQSAKFHAMIDDVAQQLTHHGQQLPAWKWKKLFMAALSTVELLPGLEPGTFVPMAKSTTELDIPEASDLIELVYAYGAERGVVFSSDKAPISIEKMRRG